MFNITKDITKWDDKQLQKELAQLDYFINKIECYSLGDVHLFGAVIEELENRGYEIVWDSIIKFEKQ